MKAETRVEFQSRLSASNYAGRREVENQMGEGDPAYEAEQERLAG